MKPNQPPDLKIPDGKKTRNTAICTSSQTCPDCGGSGWVRVVTDRYPRGAMAECHCFVFKKKMARIEELLDQSRLGKRFRRRQFSTFTPDKGTREAYELAKQYVEGYEEFSEEGLGLTFLGDVGCGKSHLAGAILQELIRKKYVPGAFVYVPKLLEKIRYSYDRQSVARQLKTGSATKTSFGKRADTAEELMELISNVAFLVLDDLGAERDSPWAKERILMVINERYEKCLPTVVTANLTLDKLEAQVGERTVSRLIEMNRTILLVADDFRRRVGRLRSNTNG